jgi:hypothetical protein
MRYGGPPRSDPMLEQEGLGVASLFGEPNGKGRRHGLRERWRLWRRRHVGGVPIPAQERRSSRGGTAADIPRPQGLPGFPIDTPRGEPPRER